MCSLSQYLTHSKGLNICEELFSFVYQLLSFAQNLGLSNETWAPFNPQLKNCKVKYYLCSRLTLTVSLLKYIQNFKQHKF